MSLRLMALPEVFDARNRSIGYLARCYEHTGKVQRVTVLGQYSDKTYRISTSSVRQRSTDTTHMKDVSSVDTYDSTAGRKRANKVR